VQSGEVDWPAVFLFHQVTHNGLCHTDAHMIDNDWGVSAFPFVPGHGKWKLLQICKAWSA
jgi:hypothetical protein